MAIPEAKFPEFLTPLQIQKEWGKYNDTTDEEGVEVGELLNIYDLKFIVRLLDLWVSSVQNKIEMDEVAHGQNTSFSKDLKEIRAFTYREFQYLFNPHVKEEDFIHLPPFYDLRIKKEAERYAVASTYDQGVTGYLSAISEKYPKLLSFFFKQLESVIPYSLIVHTWLIAPSGWGKTEFMKTLFYSQQSHTQKNRGATLMLIDVHGDVSKEVKRFKLNADKERFVFVSPSFKEGYTCRINPLNLKGLDPFEIDKVRDEFVEILSEAIDDRRGSDLTSNMTVIFQRCLSFLFKRGNSTLTDLVKLLRLEPRLIEEAKKYSDYFGTSFAETDKVTREAILKRMERLVESYALTNLLFGHSTFDLEAAIEGGKVIVFDISECSPLAMPIAGKFIFATIRAIYRKRSRIPKEERKQGYLYLDECQNFSTRTFNVVLEEMRKYRLSIFASHQYAAQMGDHLDSLRANCSIKIFGGDDADSYAKTIGVNVKAVDTLKRYEFCVKAAHLPAQKFKSSSVLIKDHTFSLTPIQEDLLDEYLLKTYYKPITKEEKKQDDEVLRPKFGL